MQEYAIYSDLPHVTRKLVGEPWLILPAHHESMVEQLVAFRTGRLEMGEEMRKAAVMKAEEKRRQMAAADPGQLNALTYFDAKSGLATVAVEGTIGKKLGWFESMCGGVDLNMVEQGLEMLAEVKPRAVQLYLDTPGGTVTGVAEAAAMVEEFSGMVAPVHAYVDVMCCSAGEWLGSAAESRSAAGSALLGSIGVYNAMYDQKRRYEAMGVEVHLAKSGPLKGAGFPGVSVPDAAVEAMQAEVDRLAAEFFAQMTRRQKQMGRALKLEQGVHFTGGTFRANTAAGSALVDAVVANRGTHLRMMMERYGKRGR